jgi:hypothetical protein
VLEKQKKNTRHYHRGFKTIHRLFQNHEPITYLNL